VAPVKETKMSDTTILAEDMKPQKTTAFANRKYTNDERLQRDEEELARLVEEQKAQAEPKEEREDEDQIEPRDAEDKSFKKRYGDLRRHVQQKEKDYETRIQALEQQLRQATQSEIKLPKSDEDIEAWATKYPDVAAIVETIAIKKAQEQTAGLETRVKEIDEMKLSAAKEKAEAELMRYHPDFDEIRSSDEFHDWAEEQPQWVQNALYENDTDAKAAARAIDLYKADKNIKTKKPSNTDAAKAVNSRNSRSRPEEDATSSYYKESQVAKMSAQEYEKKVDDIMEAIRTGKFVYDLSGNAR